MGEPPFEIGALQLISADATPGMPVTPRTDDGGPAVGEVGTTADEAEEAVEPPTTFMATTVTVTGVPLANPVSVAVRTFPTVTGLPTDGVTVYPVIAEPPFEAGATQETVTELIPATAVTFVGEPGTVAGVTADEAEDAGELPIEFVATTVNVSDVPFVKPVNEAVRTLPTVTGLPTDGVTVYPVIAEPPFEAGAVHETVAEALPATAETPVGAPGAVTGAG
jgi:hypothetical protein